MEDVQKIINKVIPQIAVDHNFSTYNFEIKPVSSEGANYTTNLYNVMVTEGTNIHHMFVKVAAVGDKMRVQNPKIYSTEMFTYTKLAKVYESLENEHNVPQKHRLVLPKFYGCNPTKYEETVVLEDLTKQGYQPFSRSKTYDWKYASSAITELAKLHALSFAYSEYYPEEFNKVYNDLKFLWDLGENVKELVSPLLQKAVDIVHENAKTKLSNVLFNSAPDSYEKFLHRHRRPVLAHGDFRPSNLMHRIHDNGKIDIKMVDFQTMQGTSPVVDVLYFLLTGSDGKFREQYYEKLLDHYYSELQAATKRFHLDLEKLYTRADFDFEWKEKLPYALEIAVFALIFVTADNESARPVDENLDMISIELTPTNDRYKELLIDLVNDYMKWGLI